MVAVEEDGDVDVDQISRVERPAGRARERGAGENGMSTHSERTGVLHSDIDGSGIVTYSSGIPCAITCE